MGRGLGKLQQAILDYLQAKGQYWPIDDIARSIYHARADVRERDPMPRSFAVSIRRAVRSLATRGQLHCGRINPQWKHEDGWRLVCWLPDHTPPRIMPPLPRETVEAHILQALRLGATRDDEIRCYLREETYVPRIEKYSQRPPGTVPYSWLTRTVIPRIDEGYYGFHQGRAPVTLHRALKRLELDEKIITWGTGQHHFVWIGLPD